MVAVTNVRGLKGEARKAVCYVGRKTAGWPDSGYGNPFKMRPYGPGGACQNTAARWDQQERDRVVAEYRAELETQERSDPAGFAAWLGGLWALCGEGARPLGCWCHPLACHAHVLAEYLNNLFVTPKASSKEWY